MKCPHCGEDIGNCEYLDPYVDKCGNRPGYKLALANGMELKVCTNHVAEAIATDRFTRVEKL